MSKDLPETISAWEYAETCGRHRLRNGIVMVDDLGDPICLITAGTVRAKKIAMLWQASPQLLKVAKEIISSEKVTDATWSDCEDVPPWLSELEAAVKAAEEGEFSTDEINETDT